MQIRTRFTRSWIEYSVACMATSGLASGDRATTVGRDGARFLP
ncbi:hypothetical protein [Nodosilinea sp. E11]|nr:hypothetical protein [Nodosilinea sp. E11]WOD36973.1 hypothetical protein RRF56_00460 [Nodosilinea sp. E11]